MQFHAEFTPSPLSRKISYGQSLFLAGSCFTEEIGNKLMRMKFPVLQNPAGILFNPVSISRILSACATLQGPDESGLMYHNEAWHHWDFHSCFSHPNKEKALEGMRSSLMRAHEYLKQTDWIIITFGSAFLYEVILSADGQPNRPVANCHKVPADTFNRRLLSSVEIVSHVKDMMQAVRSINPEVQWIFTISPVRHLREGFVDNNRSKANLIQAVHELVDENSVFYFPSYELVIDDLRDYRFYAEDMAHPNYAATGYVWEKMIQCCLDEKSKVILKEVNAIMAARQHKPFNPESQAHKQFLATYFEKARNLMQEYPCLDFTEELLYFSP